MTDTLDRDATSTQSVGQPVRRKEDARLLTGATNWTDNIQLPGALHMAIVRSPFAHARISRVDLAPALAMPGVVAAFGADELGADNAKVLCVWPVVDDIVMPEFPALAVGEVRHVGDCVAVVLATDRYRAADAAEAVEVDYEPLPAIMDMEAALADGADLGAFVVRHEPLLHEALRLRRLPGGRRRGGRGGQAPVHPAAADPRADGAAGDRGRPDGRLG